MNMASQLKRKTSKFAAYTHTVPKPAIADINPEDRDLAEELFSRSTGKLKGSTNVVDTYADSLGYKAKEGKNKKFKYKSKVFSPDEEADRELLNQLLNSKDHMIVYYKDNWTVNGLYKVFVIYGEKIDNENEISKNE